MHECEFAVRLLDGETLNEACPASPASRAWPRYKHFTDVS
jgi:hypothetical protein